MSSPSLPEQNSLSQDYDCIKAHLAVLKEQLKQNIKDIQDLKNLKDEAMNNPLVFLDQLKSKSFPSLPKLQQLYRIPDINIRNLNLSLEDERTVEMLKYLDALQLANRGLAEPVTASHWHLVHSEEMSPFEKEKSKIRENFGLNEPEISALLGETISRPSSRFSHPSPSRPRTPRGSVSHTPTSLVKDLSAIPFLSTLNSPLPTPPPLVAGGAEGNQNSMFDKKSFQKQKKRLRTPVIPWSVEEHNRLIDLLEIYPEEEKQKNRYMKIASALGTRSIAQISSRIHNLSVRGRLHRIAAATGTNYFASEMIVGRAGEALDGEFPDNDSSAESESDNVEGNKKKRGNIKIIQPVDAVHFGYRCDGCSAEPIIGKRYRCKGCEELDLCSNCKDSFTNDFHRKEHVLICVQQAEPVENRSFMGEYAYLDSSYV